MEKNGKRIQRGVIITPADLDKALNMIANEQASETKVAAKFGISRGKLSDMLNATAELTHRYARAREARAEMFVDECIQIADNASGFKDGVAKARLQTEMRMKYASKKRKLRPCCEKLKIWAIIDAYVNVNWFCKEILLL